MQLQSAGALPVSRSKWLRPAVAAALTILAAVTCFYLARSFALARYKRVPIHTQATLNTAAVRQRFRFESRQLGTNVEFIWDSQSDEVRRAEHGHLSVTDGAFTRQFWLSKPDLTSGKYVYEPTGRMISARMELYSFINAHDLSSIANRNFGATDSASQEPLHRTALAERRRSPMPPALKDIELPKPIASAATYLSLGPSAPHPAEQRNRAAQPAPPPVAFPEPPSIATSSPSTMPEILMPETVMPKVSPVSRSPEVSVRLQPAPPSFLRQAIEKVPFVRVIRRSKNGDDEFVPAQVVERPLPAIPADLVFDNQTTVECVIHIDRFGHVAKIRVIGGDDRLAGAATSAVARWRFDPARIREKPVESEMHIEFTFAYRD